MQPRLQEAALAHCELQGAQFSRARMQSVGGSYSQFQGATLDGAQLQGAYLDRAENLTQDQINTACVDENTRLPEGLTRPAPCPANP